MANKQLHNEINRKLVRGISLNCEVNIDGVSLFVDVAGWGGHLRVTHKATGKTTVWQPYMNDAQFITAVSGMVGEIKQIMETDDVTQT